MLFSGPFPHEKVTQGLRAALPIPSCLIWRSCLIPPSSAFIGMYRCDNTYLQDFCGD